MMTHIQVCDKKTARSHGVKYFGLGMIAFAVMLSSVPAQAAKNLSSVKRQCVIALVAPKEEGACKLGPDDPEAKVVLKGWYFAPDGYKYTPENPPYSAKDIMKPLDPFYREMVDANVIDILKLEKAGLSAWQQGFSGDQTGMVDSIDPDEGETVMTEAEEGAYTNGAYTKEEAKEYMKNLFAWARAWKAYRGKEFGVRK